MKLQIPLTFILSLGCILHTASADETMADNKESGVYIVMAAAFIESCTDTYPQLNKEASAFWQIVRETEQREGKRDGITRQTIKEARASCSNKNVSLTQDVCLRFIQTVAGDSPALTTEQEKELGHAIDTDIPALFNCISDSK